MQFASMDTGGLREIKMFKKYIIACVSALVLGSAIYFVADQISNPTGVNSNFSVTGAYAGYNTTGSSATTGWPTVSTTKQVTWANSLANALRIGDGVTPICLYTDSVLGVQIRPCTDSNVSTIIPANFAWSLYDIANSAAVETINPVAATTLAMYTYGTAYRPKKTVWVGAGAMSTDGAQCANPAQVTINSGAPRYTIICTNNASSRAFGEVVMPNSWDGGTVTVTAVMIQTAADTNVINADVDMACRANTVTINNTWGTSQTANIAALTGSNAQNSTTTAAITPNGTCTNADTLLQLRWTVHTTGTTTGMTTLHLVGFKITYSEKSRSS